MSTRRSEALAFSLVTGINMAMARLVDIWDSIGIMEDKRVQRMETVKKHIEDLLKNMIAEEESMKNHLRNNIVHFQEDLETLCLELALEPNKPPEGMTVLQMEKHLRVEVDALRREKAERLLEKQQLEKQDKDLCVELCATPYYIPTGSIPSTTQLKELQQHIATLTEEKTKRVAVFSGLRDDIRRLMEEMGHEPETSLERESVCSDQDIFLLTLDNINALKLLLAKIQAKRDSLVESVEQLKERTACLWSRLDCSEEDRQNFLDNVHGTLSDQMKQWRSEEERLSEQQKSRLEEVVRKVREQLLSLWELCTFSPQQREAFNTHFCCTVFTEELLAVHDAELLKVKSHHQQARPLLDTLHKWENTWALYQEFEKKANDPSRFSNRGGALLKEAKERVKVQKMLPKLEEELRSGVKLWEQSHGTDFLVWGQKVMTHISNQWEEHKQQREREKSERLQSAKKGDTTQFKTPTKRPHGGMSGPTPTKIRKTPSQSRGSVQIPNQSSVQRTSGSSATFISVSSSKPPPSSTKLKARPVDGIIHRPPLLECNSSQNPAVDTSYSDFSYDLSKKSHSDHIFNSTTKDLF
ncbi:protein regulator of cytokinesis 1 isoform X2 [Hypomesus transpacificus]|uniref:protein regulator of cytokinesis 1 isoform X2 n=1 Tax=Hypomesus transpacificus TaxID=137520 RepID=UPI001F071C59|nr:protein regulator of cytokinesis 1 isoform X2 [Hypomesus transpacificus]